MMNDQSHDIDVHFYQLVISLHAAALQQMGKSANPMTGKVERNLEMAKNSIDMLEMLERKTSGNLSDDEAKTVERALYELRLNYVDEVNKDKAQAVAESEGSQQEKKPEKTASQQQAPEDKNDSQTA